MALSHDDAEDLGPSWPSTCWVRRGWWPTDLRARGVPAHLPSAARRPSTGAATRSRRTSSASGCSACRPNPRGQCDDHRRQLAGPAGPTRGAGSSAGPRAPDEQGGGGHRRRRDRHATAKRCVEEGPRWSSRTPTSAGSGGGRRTGRAGWRVPWPCPTVTDETQVQHPQRLGCRASRAVRRLSTTPARSTWWT